MVAQNPAEQWRNKRVVITGAGRGIGAGIAAGFAAGGASVLIVARSVAELAETKSELVALGGRAEMLPVDLTVPEAAGRVIETARGLFGGIDILVTNAGAAPQGSFLELPDEAWPEGFGLKMFANLRVIRHAWPLLKESKGSIVMIGGTTAKQPERHLALVGAVNGGQAALSKAVAEQGYLDGIQVNLVQPGTIWTSRRDKLFTRLAREAGETLEQFLKRYVETRRIARLGEPGDVANAVTFLCRTESRWIHGTILDVDGGQTKCV